MFIRSSHYQVLRIFLLLLAVLLLSSCGVSDSISDTDDNPSNSNPPIQSDEIIELKARAGTIIETSTGMLIQLDGSSSSIASSSPSFDPNSVTLSYHWLLNYRPDTSQASLMNAESATPSFIADVGGTYIFQLNVSALGETSKRDLVTVIVKGETNNFIFPHAGLTSNCSNCHNGVTEWVPGGSKVIGKSPNHMAVSMECAACHTTFGFDEILRVDHQEVFGSCSECHNGVIAIGKSDSHPITSAECDNCHTTTSFLTLNPDGSFDHTGITHDCQSCHNGSTATGPDNSMFIHEAGADCSNCHNTTTFSGTHPDHTSTEITSQRCDACHGVTATGPISGHPSINPALDCNACHTITSFSMGGVYNHSSVDASIQSCDSCHNESTSINAVVKPASHIITSSDCGNCHTTVGFLPAYVDHSGSDVVGHTCVSCHDGNNIGVTGKSANHLPTGEDCVVCHSPGTFTTGKFTHAASYLDTLHCAACHDDMITIGKGVNHLPTIQDCGVCHNTSAFTPTSFNHVGIDTSNCAQCHNGSISTGLPRNHVPTSDQDCSACHSGYDTFTGALYNHQGIDPNNCAMCHDKGIAPAKPVNHIPALSECSQCHDSTATFKSTTFRNTVHQNLTQGCEGCHVKAFLPAVVEVKSASHLPTAQDCYVCHKVTAFTPSTFAHKGIANNCVACHDGNADHIAAGAIGATRSAIHQNTSEDCGICHNTTRFANAFVNHSGPTVTANRCDTCHNGSDAIGKSAKTNPPHITTTQDCKVCHTSGGSFKQASFSHKDITSNCASCHNGSQAQGKSNTHLATSKDCSVCHNTDGFAGAKYDHSGIKDNCSSCHGAGFAVGKPSDHVPTNQDCHLCHQTTGFLPAKFDHKGIVDNCSSCHGAGFAVDKPNGHVATNQDCGVCHNTRTFKGATFDHTGIVDNCDSCHNGSTAKGKNNTHIQTNLDCHFCHTTATFVGGSWNHQGITNNCTSCHDGRLASTHSSWHFITTQDCNVCHVTSGWAPTRYSHQAYGGYPGDHAKNLGCQSCHQQNNEKISYRYSNYAGYCAGCHAGDYKPGEDEHHGLSRDKDCGRCHQVNSREWDGDDDHDDHDDHDDDDDD